jgi:hypothetical protein
MDDKLVKWLRRELPMGDDCIAPDYVCVAGDCPCDSQILLAAAERIEFLEQELSEETQSRKVAAEKAWEFSDSLKLAREGLKQIVDAKADPCGKFCGAYLDLQVIAANTLNRLPKSDKVG